VTGARTFPGEPTSIAAARRFVANELADVGERLDAIVLLVSELATNSVLHAASAFRLTIRRTADEVCVEVCDDGGGSPAQQPHHVAAPSGRGLQIVEALSDQWGVREQPPGKVVWFTVALPTD
jgi:anti-sigma regulatory factor (Ser/Thr protein kinase)